MGKPNCTFVLMLVLTSGIALAKPPVQIPSDGFSDSPAPLERKRSEAEEDALKASALFAQGRLNFQRQNFAKALSSYQRAYRYSPRVAAIIKEIVPLAASLQKEKEAATYAAIAITMPIDDMPTAAQLGMILSQEEDWKGATTAYERLLELQEKKTTFPALSVQMELGRLAFLDKKYKASAEHFQAVLKALEDPAKLDLSRSQQLRMERVVQSTYPVIAESFLQCDDLENAEKMFRKANDARSNPAGLSLNLARIQFKQDRTADARRNLEKYIASRQTSGGIAAYKLLKEIIAKEVAKGDERRSKLRKELQGYLAKDTSNIPLAYFLAAETQKTGDYRTAVTVFSKLLKRAPTRDVFNGLIESAIELNDYTLVLSVLGQVVTGNGTLSVLGDEMMKKLKADKQLTAKLIEAAEKISPPVFAESLALGVLTSRQENHKLATVWYRKAADVAKPSQREQLFRLWAIDLYIADKNDEASEVLNRALAEKEIRNKQIFYYLLSGALAMQKDFDKARVAAKRAAALAPSNPRMAGRVAWIDYRAKQFEKAREAYAKILKDHRNRQEEPSRDAVRESRMMLSNIATSEKKIGEAVEWLEQVLDENPNDVGALNDLGYLWADHDLHLNRALSMTKRAVEAQPDNSSYRDSLGWAYFKLGRFKESLEQLEKAIELEKEPDGVILDHLADAYAKTGQDTKAREFWQKALTAFDDETDAEQKAKVVKKLEQKTNK